MGASAIFAAATLFAAAPAQVPDPRGLEGLSSLGLICGVTHVGFYGDVATVTATKANFGGAVIYREGEGPWVVSPLKLRGPHSVIQLPNGRWLIGDTDNHRLVQVDDLSGKGEVSRAEIAGVKLNRPHDEIVDPVTGDIYVIDGGRNLFRFRNLDGPAQVWTFTPEELNYDRSLSWIDGKLHLIHSSRGEVLRIDDFEKRAYTVFRSPRPKDGPLRSSTPFRDFPAGALSVTGLVLNDVEKFDGWYYGANFFTPSYAGGADTGPARLIRWRTWDDFSAGRWEDVSDRLPVQDPPVTPYFLTAHDEGLYVAWFAAEDLCGPGGFVRVEKDAR